MSFLHLTRLLRQEKTFLESEKFQISDYEHKLSIVYQDLFELFWKVNRQKTILNLVLHPSIEFALAEGYVDDVQSYNFKFVQSHSCLGLQDGIYSELVQRSRKNSGLMVNILLKAKELGEAVLYRSIELVYSCLLGSCLLEKDMMMAFDVLEGLANAEFHNSHVVNFSLIFLGSAFVRLFQSVSTGILLSNMFLSSALRETILQSILPSTEAALSASNSLAEDHTELDRMDNAALESLVDTCLQNISKTLSLFPRAAAYIIYNVYRRFQDKAQYGSLTVSLTTMMVFHLYICPVIRDPKRYGVFSGHFGSVEANNLSQVADALEKYSMVSGRKRGLQINSQLISEIVMSIVHLGSTCFASDHTMAAGEGMCLLSRTSIMITLSQLLEMVSIIRTCGKTNLLDPSIQEVLSKLPATDGPMSCIQNLNPAEPRQSNGVTRRVSLMGRMHAGITSRVKSRSLASSIKVPLDAVSKNEVLVFNIGNKCLKGKMLTIDAFMRNCRLDDRSLLSLDPVDGNLSIKTVPKNKECSASLTRISNKNLLCSAANRRSSSVTNLMCLNSSFGVDLCANTEAIAECAAKPAEQILPMLDGCHSKCRDVDTISLSVLEAQSQNRNFIESSLLKSGQQYSISEESWSKLLDEDYLDDVPTVENCVLVNKSDALRSSKDVTTPQTHLDINGDIKCKSTVFSMDNKSVEERNHVKVLLARYYSNTERGGVQRKNSDSNHSVFSVGSSLRDSGQDSGSTYRPKCRNDTLVNIEQNTLVRLRRCLSNVSMVPLESREDKDPIVQRRNFLALLRSELSEALMMKDCVKATDLASSIQCVENLDQVELNSLLDVLYSQYSERVAYANYLVERHYCIVELMSLLDRYKDITHRIQKFSSQCFMERYVDQFIGNNIDKIKDFRCQFQQLIAFDEKTELFSTFLETLNADIHKMHCMSLNDNERSTLVHKVIEQKLIDDVFRLAFYPNCEADTSRDEVLYNHMCHLSTVVTLTSPYLKISQALQLEAPWPSAQDELVRLNTSRTAFGKVECIVRCCSIIISLLQTSTSRASGVPSADDLMPVLVYVLLQARPVALLSNIQYVNNFYNGRFTGEQEYCWVQFCAAVEFIKTMDYKNI